MPEQDKPQVPNYVRVQNYILDKCKSGEYAVGTRIPSETELARMFSVSRITANKAVSELALRGVLKRIRGKGSFVVSTAPTAARASQAFSATVITKVSGGKKHELSQFRVLSSCPELAQKLGKEVTQCDPLSLSVACHIGPGALAVACSKKIDRYL